MADPPNESPEQLRGKILNRRSVVRIAATYGAAGFLFVVGPIIILVLAWKGDKAGALTVFNTLLPVASAIVSFWFGGNEGKPAATTDVPDYPCPIDGCTHVFRGTRKGWQSHVSNATNHPNWNKDITTPKERQARFIEEFGESWF